MEFKILILVIASLVISTMAMPFPFPNQLTGNVLEVSLSDQPLVNMKEPMTAGTSSTETTDQAEDRADGDGGAPMIGPMMNSVFGGKKPFEAISGPYYSSSIGPAFQSGPFGGLGVPLSSGPLGGVMGIPLLFLTRNG